MSGAGSNLTGNTQQPAAWNYSVQPNGRSIATYPGDVNIAGSILDGITILPNGLIEIINSQTGVPVAVGVSVARAGNLQAADAVATANSVNTFLDASVTIPDNTGTITLSSRLVPYGGVITVGANNTFTLPLPVHSLSPITMFSVVATSVVTFLQADGVVEGTWFAPPVTPNDCIVQWNCWKNSASWKGARWAWPAGSYHTLYSNKFLSPTNARSKFDFTGVILDSTFVREGQGQVFSTMPTIACQVQAVVTGATGNFSLNNPISISGYTGGNILAWNAGTNTLTVGGYDGISASRFNHIGAVITDVATGNTATISSVNNMIGAGTETGNSGGGVTKTIISYNQYAPCLCMNGRYGHTLGLTGTNTSGASVPTYALQLDLAMQDNVYNLWSEVGSGRYGFCLDVGLTNSFENGDVWISPSSAFPTGPNFVANGVNDNYFCTSDLENSSSKQVIILNVLSTTFMPGFWDNKQAGAYSLNYTSTSNRINVIGVRATIAPLASNALAVTGVTKANPGIVTYTGTDPANGDFYAAQSIGGMVQLDNQLCIVTNVNVGAKTFELWDIHDNTINTTGYTTFTAGGNFLCGQPFQGIMMDQDGGTYAGFNNIVVDSVTSTKGIFSGHTFLENSGLSDYLASSIVYTNPSDHRTGHTLAIDTTGFGTADAISLKIRTVLYFNFTTVDLGGFNFDMVVGIDGTGNMTVASPAAISVLGCVAVEPVITTVGRVITMTWNTTSSILTCKAFINYGDSKGVNLG